MLLNKKRKGIILAGGTGSRLMPLTLATSKQLIPVYDKPMIYYPISTLLIAGIKEILIICTKTYLEDFKRLLKDGSQWGISIQYSIQESPDGIAQALLIGESFLNGSPMCIILGDNLFYGDDLSKKLKNANEDLDTNTIFAYQVKDPTRYGIIEFDKELNIKSLKEKPLETNSNYAVTGIYFYKNSAIDKAKKLTPSNRGELEITELNQYLLKVNNLKVNIMRRGMAWLDTGTIDDLFEASAFIKAIENRQGLKIGCPEEIAWKLKYIDDNDLKNIAKKYPNNDYGNYLINLI